MTLFTVLNPSLKCPYLPEIRSTPERIFPRAAVRKSQIFCIARNAHCRIQYTNKAERTFGHIKKFVVVVQR